MPTNANTVQYTGVALSYIGVTPNQYLGTILSEINTAVNNLNPSPNFSAFNYGPYNGYTVTTTTGGVPSTIQEFVEGISKIVDIDQYNLANFIATTYAADQTVLSSAISALQTPALTYSVTAGGSSIVITSGMTRNQVLSATYTGVGSILNLLAAPGNTWSNLSISTPVTILAAFNDLITYIANLTTTVSGKQSTIGTFDATPIGGGATDSISTTVNELIAYTAALPSYTSGAITWGCITPGGDIQSDIQAIVTFTSYIANTYISSAGTGMSVVSGSACNGNALSIDTTWVGLYKVAVDSSDTTPNSLLAKLTAGTGISLTVTSPGGNETVLVTNSLPADGKTLVNSSDTISNYLQAKLPSSPGNWGLANIVAPTVDNSQLTISPTITDPTTFVTNLMSYVASDPALLALWCSINSQCAGCTCTAPSNLTVSLGMGTFILAWTIGGTPVSQMTEYRQRGFVDWITNVNISPTNPEANDITTSTVSNLDDNTVYQFQIESVCSGATNGSNVYEAIRYSCQSLTAVVVGGIISVNQSILSTIDTIQYQLLNVADVVVDSQTATGLAPNANFASQDAGTYHVNWRMGTLINGVMSYSDDQLEGWCTLTGIVIS